MIMPRDYADINFLQEKSVAVPGLMGLNVVWNLGLIRYYSYIDYIIHHNTVSEKTDYIAIRYKIYNPYSGLVSRALWLG